MTNAPLLHDAPAPCQEQPTSPSAVAAPRQHPVPRGANSFDIDEAQLLAETEELLGSLDPIAFVVTHAPASLSRVVIAAPFRPPTNSSTVDSSGDDTSTTSQSPTQLDTVNKCGRKRSPKPGAMRNPSRERLQNELAYLRQQVLVLENELQNVQETREPNGSTQSVVVVPMWERVAKRQLAACDRAVKDNKRLKSMLDLQKELVVSMEESLYNWQHGATLLPVLPPDDSLPLKNVHLEPGDDLLFEMLVSELDATYMKIDEPFREAGLNRVGIESFTRATPKTQVSSDGILRSYFEMVEVEVSPFNFEMVHRVAKICGEKQSQSPDCAVYHGDWGTEHVITEKYRVKRVFNGVEIYFHMLFALKEFVFEDHIVCVWRSMFKSKDGHFPDAYVQEMGWLMSTSLTSPNTSNGAKPVGSITKMCVHLEPKRFDAPTTVIRAETDTMTTLVKDSYQDDMQEMNDMMENMLIQETSTSRSTRGVPV